MQGTLFLSDYVSLYQDLDFLRKSCPFFTENTRNFGYNIILCYNLLCGRNVQLPVAEFPSRLAGLQPFICLG